MSGSWLDGLRVGFLLGVGALLVLAVLLVVLPFYLDHIESVIAERRAQAERRAALGGGGHDGD